MMKEKHRFVLFVEKYIFLLSGAWLLWIVWLFIYAVRNGGTMNWVGVITQLIGLVVVTVVATQGRRRNEKGE